MLGIDAELQKELIEFVKTSQSDKATRPLKAHLVEELLKQIVEGEREITGLITNHKTGDVFVKFSFSAE
jgi:hypothetical protein